MKKRLFSILLSVMLISVCIGCGGESTATEQTEAVETPATEESTPAQTVEEATVPEEAEVPTPEATAEQIEELERETETTLMSETEITSTEEPIPEPQVVYTYTDMTATMYATQTVNVRSLPSTDGEKVGSLSTNQEVLVIGQCNETSWYMFDYNGQTAFVSNKYLTTEKVEVAPPANSDDGENSGASGYPNPYDYPEGVWIDMGDWFLNVNSYEWGMNWGNFADIETTLQTRFPGEAISSGGGFPLNDGSGRYCWFSFRQGTYLVPFTNAYMAK